MRGFPLLRTLLTALVLTLAALPLWRITRNQGENLPGVGNAASRNSTAAVTMSVPFTMTLSATASRIIIRDETGSTLWQSESPVSAQIDGLWSRLPSSVLIEISWSESSAPRYFAKLRLDPPGRSSLTHVFDAAADIDDLWELP